MDSKSSVIKSIFLLGGHDLEMLEIKKILLSEGISYFDKNLLWANAKLSQYIGVLNNTNHFVGIELITDMETPANYTLIDHHNENAEKPSAIEQVADFLGIELTRDQLLVAANDKGYIPAMEVMGATSEEIADIRKRDRGAQGVTEEDEQQADISIQEHLSVNNGITVVKSLTSKFSTITDRLYPCDKLLIYTDNELTYFGKNVLRLELAFESLINQKKAYYGGGENGFFGLTNEGITLLGDKNNLIDQIINLL
jgi:hypothetical protein